ncbi:MAG: hypothetical protein ACE5IR_19890 [bacterium]
MKSLILALALALHLCAGCKESAQINTPATEILLFQDGFETSDGVFSSLFVEDGSRWSNLQLVNPFAGPENQVVLSSTKVHSGCYALEIVCHPSDSIVSKADLEKYGFRLYAGDRVTISAWFYIEGLQNLQSVFLIDLECIDCWDPSVPDNPAPGMRLMFSGGDDYLVVERGKIGLRGESLRQSSFHFPRNRWVELKWILDLSPNEDGKTELYLDGQQILAASGINMPNADIFARIAEENGIDFQLQEPVYYERLQVGVTANSGEDSVHIFLDDVSIGVISGGAASRLYFYESAHFLREPNAMKPRRRRWI